jgi:hypothetical protein
VLGPPAEPLTLALALTETFTLTEAVAAPEICVAHESASVPRLAPIEMTLPAA